MPNKFKGDFEYLLNLAQDFFKKKDIVSKLQIIGDEDNEISGWETWLQIEFYIYLASKRDLVKNVVREYQYDLDQRTKYVQQTRKIYCAIDIEIEKKNAKANERWIPLELKQAKIDRVCIKNMLSDCDKYNSIKRSEKIRGGFRYPFFLGIFQSEKNGKEIDEKRIRYLISRYDYKIQSIKVESIKKTSLSFLLLH